MPKYSTQYPKQWEAFQRCGAAKLIRIEEKFDPDKAEKEFHSHLTSRQKIDESLFQSNQSYKSKNNNIDTLLGFLTLGLYVCYLNFSKKINFVENRRLRPKSAVGEWINAVLFAIIAATIIHVYFIQPYIIIVSQEPSSTFALLLYSK